jgi:hypothetical protein
VATGLHVRGFRTPLASEPVGFSSARIDYHSALLRFACSIRISGSFKRLWGVVAALIGPGIKTSTCYAPSRSQCPYIVRLVRSEVIATTGTSERLETDSICTLGLAMYLTYSEGQRGPTNECPAETERAWRASECDAPGMLHKFIHPTISRLPDRVPRGCGKFLAARVG